MRVVKKLDKRNGAVSAIFDKTISSYSFGLPFDVIEFHLRDIDTTIVEGKKAVICLDSTNPLIVENDARAIRTLIMRELFRITFSPDFPRIVGDVLAGREMIKRGLGDDLFYTYYNFIMKTKTGATSMDYIKLNLPWIIFRGFDNYNSSFLRELAQKIQPKKFREADNVLNMLCHDKFAEASELLG
jgi:hypothetical protein